MLRFDDIDLTVGAHAVERYTVRVGDYSSATGTAEWRRELSRGDWRIHTRTRTRLTSDNDTFHIEAELDAYEGDTRVFCRFLARGCPARQPLDPMIAV